MVGRASNASTRGIHQTMSKLDRRYASQEADGGQCSGSRVRYYLHPAIDYHDRLTPAIGHADSIAWHKPALGYLLSTIYPCVRPERHLNRRRCNHATTCAARSRAFPIGMLMIALSEGSQSPLPAVVSVLLVLNVHGKRAFSSCSAYEFCRLQHSCYVNLGIRILTTFHLVYPDLSMGISTIATSC